MYEIPKPELLDPNRVNRDEREHFTAQDHRSQAQLLAEALDQSCDYADQLWDQVNALRAYLLASLPPDPRDPDAPLQTGASPTGPDDEDGWRDWIAAFATTTSVLCGAHGDSGFGVTRARQEAQRRRRPPEPAPVSATPVHHEEAAASERQDAPPDQGSDAQPSRVVPVPEATAPSSSRDGAIPILKAVGGVVLAVLALRGLRTLPPRPAAPPE